MSFWRKRWSRILNKGPLRTFLWGIRLSLAIWIPNPLKICCLNIKQMSLRRNWWMRKRRNPAILRSHSTWTMTHHRYRVKKPINFQILPRPYRNHLEIRKNRHPFLSKMIAKRNRERWPQPHPLYQHNRPLLSSMLRHPVLNQRQRHQRLWLVIVIVMYKVIPRNHLRRFLLQYYNPPHNCQRRKARVIRLKV